MVHSNGRLDSLSKRNSPDELINVSSGLSNCSWQPMSLCVDDSTTVDTVGGFDFISTSSSDEVINGGVDDVSSVMSCCEVLVSTSDLSTAHESSSLHYNNIRKDTCVCVNPQYLALG